MNYEKIYHQLVHKAKSENRKKLKKSDPNYVYYEGHHILPRSLGGNGDTRDITHPNIVLLTAKEHFIAHLLLVKIYPNSREMQNAWWTLAHVGKYKVSSRQFERARIEKSKAITGDSNPMKREEVRAKFRGDLNVWRKPENKDRFAGKNNPMYGTKRLDTTLRNKIDNPMFREDIRLKISKPIIRTNNETGEIKEFPSAKYVILEEEHKHIHYKEIYSYANGKKLPKDKKYSWKYKQKS